MKEQLLHIDQYKRIVKISKGLITVTVRGEEPVYMAITTNSMLDTMETFDYIQINKHYVFNIDDASPAENFLVFKSDVPVDVRLREESGVENEDSLTKSSSNFINSFNMSYLWWLIPIVAIVIVCILIFRAKKNRSVY